MNAKIRAGAMVLVATGLIVVWYCRPDPAAVPVGTAAGSSVLPTHTTPAPVGPSTPAPIATAPHDEDEIAAPPMAAPGDPRLYPLPPDQISSQFRDPQAIVSAFAHRPGDDDFGHCLAAAFSPTADIALSKDVLTAFCSARSTATLSVHDLYQCLREQFPIRPRHWLAVGGRLTDERARLVANLLATDAMARLRLPLHDAIAALTPDESRIPTEMSAWWAQIRSVAAPGEPIRDVPDLIGRLAAADNQGRIMLLEHPLPSALIQQLDAEGLERIRHAVEHPAWDAAVLRAFINWLGGLSQAGCAKRLLVDYVLHPDPSVSGRAEAVLLEDKPDEEGLRVLRAALEHMSSDDGRRTGLAEFIRLWGTSNPAMEEMPTPHPEF